MRGRVLVIAGSDSGGGAGIQADIKTITHFGAYASTAITALTAQNTEGVFGIHDIPPEFIKQQIEVVTQDIGADVIKTGMLSNAEVIKTVADTIPEVTLVIDPVMVAKGGELLLKEDAIDELKNRLIPMSYLVTPNIPEAEALTGLTIKSAEDMETAGRKIINECKTKAVLVKGGHMDGDIIKDVLVTNNDVKIWESKRINSKDTHGTGCTLASAIAALLSQNIPIEEAIEKAREYVISAIKTSPGLGKGHGPLNHAVAQYKSRLHSEN